MENNSIPRRIFYVWGANEPKKRDVNMCILTWRQILPDYEIIEINEDSIEYFNFQEELKNNKWFKIVYEKKLYAYIADYIRIKVLYEYGGIYLDTDVSVLKPFDDVIDNNAFIGMQDCSSHSSDNLEPAILGSNKGNPILKEILNVYQKEIWEKPIYSMPQIFNYVLNKLYGNIFYPDREKQQIIKLENITIYPEAYFIPYRFIESFSPDCIKQETHTIHWWNGSWCNDNIYYFLKNKHLQKTETLLAKCFKKTIILDNNFIKIEKLFHKLNIHIDFNYIFRFKSKFVKNKKYLTVFIFGFQITLWRVKYDK